jgi:uncharacterized membrane protein
MEAGENLMVREILHNHAMLAGATSVVGSVLEVNGCKLDHKTVMALIQLVIAYALLRVIAKIVINQKELRW